MGQTQRIQTFGEISSEFIVELVAGDTPTEALKLLVWNGSSHLSSEVSIANPSGAAKSSRVLYPPDVDSTLRRIMRFPTLPAPCGSARELVQDLCAVINRFIELPTKLTELVAFSVLSSWFVDCAVIPASLWIVGPRFGPGSQLLRLLNSLYRRPLLLGEISLAGLYSLPFQLRPSLLFEQWEISSDLQAFLKALHTGDGRILRKSQVIDIGCTTAICTEEPLKPSASGKAIEIPIARSRRLLEVLDQQVQDKIANDFQPKLLMYRLTNARSVHASASTVSESMFAIGQFARCWEACAAGDPDL
jgi:hypothetical protein